MAAFAPALTSNLPDIEVSNGEAGPFVAWQLTTDGRAEISLATEGPPWAQLTFQFAHEFCHLLCNHRKDSAPFRWIEESFCEAASLYALRQLGLQSLLKGTALPFITFRSERLYEPEHNLPPATSFSSWAANARSWIQGFDWLDGSDGTRIRAALVIVATQLFDRLAADEGAAWACVRYLNIWDRTPKTAGEYLQAWRNAAPEEMWGHIDHFRAVLAPLL
ncbi:MAG TPA: hypothetical protein VFK05_14535 [Polyangiaceae bacterium]|nr:hypothetical protein [Polyangiaceae bacterium]